MTFLTRNFDPLTPLAPKFPTFAVQILLFAWNTLLPSSHMHMCYTFFYITWVRGVACQKQRLGPKLEGAELGEHPKIWDPLRISAIVEASTNLVHNLGLGLAYQKQCLWPNWRRSRPGEHPKKILGPPKYFGNRCSPGPDPRQFW